MGLFETEFHAFLPLFDEKIAAWLITVNVTSLSSQNSATPAHSRANSSLRHWLLLWGHDLKRMIGVVALAAAVLGAMAVAGYAAPGQCTVSGYSAFDCDVVTDGGGLTFGLPDGRTFAFALMEEGVGMGYLIEADAAPGARPEEIHDLLAVDGKPGCWAREDEFEFCVLIEQ
ncbi:hypothetical protein [Devosia psychrophila]|uniref:Uncharacterized protein n=1 Tax=Devosia psychrophila TaxID=728005 RepID=A0A0F5Q3Q1_9HYPH|nr:hypothetical protein [Devosia psychrophila]KKC34699.1 hypothetical protein WH91_01485 [Devosia psychrophila]SFC87799.1 hypothetical protein SAMN04488059_11373 [Devosia psychrophila]